MLDTLPPLCDAVACGRPTAGSYLDAAAARSITFAVCAEHLSRLQAGQRPTIMTTLTAGRVDVAASEARPRLLFPLDNG